MPADSANPAPPVALVQFLRGIGKRGYVLAEAQCGEIARAQQALTATIGEFRDASAHLPLAQWPEQFWQRLLSQPTLRAYTAASSGEDPLAHLSAGPRAALLLRLVAGLDQTHGAAVLRVSPPAYRQALFRALHALHEQGIDETALRALRERLQQRVKALPEQFLQATASQEPAPLKQRVLASSRPRPPRVPRSPPRWLRPSLWVVLAALALLFVATFVRIPMGMRNAVKIERLPEQPVAAKLSPAAAALASPDFELLNDPDGERYAGDLALLSWFDASAATSAAPASAPNPATLPETTTPETSAPDTEQTEGGRPGAP
jgi:hypothetical protein